MSETSVADAITSDSGIAPDAETPSVPATETPAPAEQPAETKPQTNGEAPVTEPPPAPQAVTQPAQAEADDKTVRGLIHALGDEREKRQKERTAREEAERRVAQYEAERSRFQFPNAADQPEEFQQALTGWQRQVEYQNRVEISKRWAVNAHGNDKLEEAAKWGVEQGAPFKAWFDSQPDPFGWLMQQYQRHELVEKIGKDPDAWARQRVAELSQTNGATPLATGQAQAVQTPTAHPQPQVPKSLATAPNAGGGMKTVPVHGVAALDEVFRGSG